MEWVPAWEAGGYYKEAPEETAYAVQEGPPITPIQPAHIPWFAPKYMATTVPLRRVAPSAAAVPAPQNACFNCGDVGHYAPNCPHPRRQRGFVLLCKNCAQVNQVELSPDEKDEDDEWPDEETMVKRVEIRSASRKKEVPVKKSKRDKKDAKKKKTQAKGATPEDFGFIGEEGRVFGEEGEDGRRTSDFVTG